MAMSPRANYNMYVFPPDCNSEGSTHAFASLVATGRSAIAKANLALCKKSTSVLEPIKAVSSSTSRMPGGLTSQALARRVHSG